MNFKIGAHVSVAGGYKNAIIEAVEIGANCGQIFTHSPRMWAVPNVLKPAADEFKKLKEENGIGPWMAHGTYLMNTASSEPRIWNQSVAMLKKELEAASALGLEYVCFHPGSNPEAQRGLENLVKAINETAKLYPDVTLLAEIMAGTGNIICNTFEHLKYVLDKSKRKEIGVCLDTCHMYTAGYDIATKNGMKKTMDIIKETIGIDSIKMIHLNDSQYALGERKDRHEHIGKGKIGMEGMKIVLNQKELRKIPFVLETPEDENGYGHKKNIEMAIKLAGL